MNMLRAKLTTLFEELSKPYLARRTTDSRKNQKDYMAQLCPKGEL